MDENILMEILGCDRPPTPELRPGYIVGYSCKLWGQYPTLISGPAGNIIEGMVYDVRTVEDGQKLAAYETRNYAVEHCEIVFTDGKEPSVAAGSVFTFAGDPRELSEGSFDLGTWLRRMGRSPADIIVGNEEKD
jgi:hypothetical protein